MLTNKKAQDFSFGIIALGSVFVFAIVGLIIVQILTEVNTEISADNGFSPIAIDLMDDSTEKVTNWVDNSVLFIYITLTIISIIFAVLTFVNPVFFVVSLMMITLQVLASAYFSDMWTRISSTPELIGSTSQLTISGFFLNNLPWVTLIISVVIGIITYSKFRE